MKKKFKDSLDYIQPSKYIVKNDQYSNIFTTPVLTAGSSFILGYTNETEGVYFASKENPIILFDDFTTATQWVDFPFKVKSSACKILIPKQKENIRYLYYALKAVKFNNYQHKRYWISEFSNIEYNDFGAENEAIVKLLDLINNAIQNNKNELCLLDELIKSRFIEMFGDLKSMQNSSIKMGDVVTINPKKDIIDDNLDVTFLPMEKVSVDGTIDVSTIRKYSEVKKGFNHVKENDVLFAKITPCMENGKSTIARGLCNGYANTTTELFGLRCSEKVVPEYIYSIVHSKEFRIQAESNMTGSAGQRRVPKSFIEDFHINVPPMKDQLAYASFVEQVDKSKFVVHSRYFLWEILTLFSSTIA